jgi:hypothetical protein
MVPSSGPAACGCQIFGSHHATCAYSWISPPRRSRRTILAGGAKTTGTPGPSGGACPKARCGRGRCNGRRTPPAPTAAAGIPRSASDPAPHGEPCPPTAPRRHPQRHAWTTTPVWVGPTAPDQVAMPSQQRGRLHQQPAPDRAGQQPRQPSQHRAVSPVQIGVGPPAGGAPQPRAATSAAPRCWSPSAVPAAPAIARAGRRSDRAVEVPSIDHRR